MTNSTVPLKCDNQLTVYLDIVSKECAFSDPVFEKNHHKFIFGANVNILVQCQKHNLQHLVPFILRFTFPKQDKAWFGIRCG